MARDIPPPRIAHLFGLLVPVLIVSGGVALAGATTAFGLSRLQATPDAASGIWPGRAARHLRLGQASLAANDLPNAAAMARQALVYDPLCARGYSLLGQVAIAGEDAPEADEQMAAAARRSLRDAPSQTWIFARALARGDFRAAMSAYDVLMRRRPDLADRLSPPVFAAADGLVEARAALAERLALAPAWRSSFLRTYSRDSSEPAAVHALLSALRGTPSPPTDPEMQVYLDRLLRDRAYVAAYVAWAQHQPEAAALAGAGVTDGGFEQVPGLAPFSWRLRAGDGASAGRTSLPDGEGVGLRATVSGGLTRRSIAEQLIVLPMGEYRLRGKAWLENGDPEGRLLWTVQCEGGATLASVEASGNAPGRWAPFETAVIVPDECPAQRLRLETRPGSSLVPVSILYDEIEITRRSGGRGLATAETANSRAGFL